ncbi:MAG TPA: PAS domain S-box protein, partial [Methylomirabilota bacterium]|nr:PAS domain S-box protein [Methylomirabilota bacterium]
MGVAGRAHRHDRPVEGALSRPRLTIELDPAAAAHARTEREYRLHVVSVPAARFVGHALLVVCVALHNRFILGAFDPAAFTRFAFGIMLYSLAAWGVLRVFYRSHPGLGRLFLVTDIVAWTFVIYYSGGDRSWLFFLMFMRAADLQMSGARAVLVAGHLSVLCYAAMLGWLIGVEHRPVALGAEAAKLAIIYAVNLYFVAPARTAQGRRSKLVEAIRVARELLAGRDAAVADLRQNEEWYRGVFETVNDPIMTATLDGRVTGVNRAFERAMGYPREEIIGRHYSTLTTPAVAEASAERLRRAASGEVLPSTEVVGVAKSGEQLTFEVRTALIRDHGGTPVGVVGIYRDIRQRKQTEEALERAKELAEETSRAKSNFLANMSHELRTPLNSIIGFTKLMLRRLDGELNSRQEAYVRSVLNSSTHLLTLINNVLDLSRIEAGKQELSVDEIDAGALVEDCLDSARSLASGKDLTVESAVAPGLPRLYADRMKIKQVLLNLLSNAVRFTRSGRVVVRVAADEEGMR